MSDLEAKIAGLKHELRSIGKIIDDRSYNGIPLFAYVHQYRELKNYIEYLEASK